MAGAPAMGSCVSKKAARAGAGGKVAAPLPPEKENALPPVVVEEEVKEVLSETPVPRPRPPAPEQEKHEQEEEEASESASVASAAAEKAKAKAGGEQVVEQRAVVDAQEKGRARRRAPEQRKPKDDGNGRARSPSPASAQRRQAAGSGEQPAAPRPRREQPAVVSGIGCRSGRFSPSAARRAAESAVRRTHSAREADMMLPAASRTPAKRSLNASINGNGNAYGGTAVRRDPGERSGRRPDSPTARRPPASPAANGAIHRQASAGVGATRKAAKDNTTPEQTKPQCSGGGGRAPGKARDELDEVALAGGGEHKEVAQGSLGQNPSVAMECFIFL